MRSEDIFYKMGGIIFLTSTSTTMANALRSVGLTRRWRHQHQLERQKLQHGRFPRKEFRPSKYSARRRLTLAAVVFIFGFPCSLWTIETSFRSIMRSLLLLSPTAGSDSTALLSSSLHTSSIMQQKMNRFPRVVHFAQDDTNGQSATLTGLEPVRSRKVPFLGDRVAQSKIKRNDKISLDKVEDEECKLRYDWQKSSRPTCNTLHEFDSTSPLSAHGGGSPQELYSIVGHGFWRDVWILNYAADTKGVFKSMRYDHDYTPRNFDRMRRDALTMERLTESKFIIDIYSFCGTSSVSELGEGGDIPDALWPNPPSQLEKLRIATQAAIGLATVHNIDKEGEASIAHTDVSSSQFIKVGDIYKLNDFNRARFLAFSAEDDTMCPYHIGNNPGKNRSPEEYDYGPQTEMVDLYSLGNIFYMLLQGEYPFEDLPSKEVREVVREGRRPTIFADLWNSTDPVNNVLKDAMIMCHEQLPSDRPSAREVELFLRGKMQQLDPGTMETW